MSNAILKFENPLGASGEQMHFARSLIGSKSDPEAVLRMVMHYDAFRNEQIEYLKGLLFDKINTTPAAPFFLETYK